MAMRRFYRGKRKTWEESKEEKRGDVGEPSGRIVVRRTGPYVRGLSYGGAAAAAAAAMNVRTGGLLGIELKAFDTHRSLVAISNANTWAGGEYETATYGLFCPTQGSAINNRDGQRTIVKSILVQGIVQRSVEADQADVRESGTVQVSLVMDRQTNGAQLNAEDVYVATAPAVPAQRVLEYAHRFRVLKTVLIDLHDVAAFSDGANTGSVTGNSKSFTLSWKGSVPANFVAGAGAGAVADLRDVSFHIIACSTSPASADYIRYNSRVRFVG